MVGPFRKAAPGGLRAADAASASRSERVSTSLDQSRPTGDDFRTIMRPPPRLAIGQVNLVQHLLLQQDRVQCNRSSAAKCRPEMWPGDSRAGDRGVDTPA